MKLLLTQRKASPWLTENGISFCGYFLADGKCFQAQDAIAWIREKRLSLPFHEILTQIDGVFSVIIESGDSVFAAVNRVRSFPLFYAVENGECIIADTARAIYDALHTATVDPVSAEEFRRTHVFVSGHHTLYREIKQVQAGEWIRFDAQNASVHREFYYIHGDALKHDWTDEEFLAGFQGAFEKACENLRLALRGRTAAVSLSGGVDSREILAMLSHIGYEKVICFTYGSKLNRDHALSHQSAKSYGYGDRWMFIEYNASTWAKLRRTTEFQDFIQNAGNLCAVPELQDFAAAKYLKDHDILPDDAVILTGNTGLIVGGLLPPGFLQEPPVLYDELIDLLTKNFYGTGKISQPLKDRLTSYIEKKAYTKNEEGEAQYYRFNMLERQCKFCIQGHRIFEHFGYEWVLPLCDVHLLEYMKHVPLHLKRGKNLVRTFLSLSSDAGTVSAAMQAYANVGSAIRKASFLRKIVRKASKLTKYFRSRNRLESIFPMGKYMKAALLGDETFTINHILAHDAVKRLKEKP